MDEYMQQLKGIDTSAQEMGGKPGSNI